MTPFLWVAAYLIENGRKIASIALLVIAAVCIIGVCVAPDTGLSSLAVAGILGITLGFIVKRAGTADVLLTILSVLGVCMAILVRQDINWWPHGVTIFTVGIIAAIVGDPLLPDLKIVSYYPPGHAKYEGDKQP